MDNELTQPISNEKMDSVNSSKKPKLEVTEEMKAISATKPVYLTECCPVKSLEDLYTIIGNPPNWSKKIVSRFLRSPTAIQNFLSDCHYEVDDYIIKSRVDVKFIPKTLVCHDYKGGYLEDRYLSEVNKGSLYSFYNWSHIDIFVYFSHNFITIPPLCWINTAHQNGVKILGTIITEFKEGEIICSEIFKDISTMQSFARHLAKIVELFKLDGWLLNIENPINNILLLKSFVGYLTECVHQVDPEALIIWYDSVIKDGKLSWQNELNESNICFFEQCDGIYLNYVWTEEKLLNSIRNAGLRKLDVFVGIDIFGRNTFGGGEFFSYKAAEVIRRHGLSMAIFAPGWTHESIVETSNDSISLMEHFLNKDSAFWSSLGPYLYTHPIVDFFETSFFRGVDKNRFNMFEQHQQLSKILHPKYSYLIANYTEIPTLERQCHCLRLEYDNERPSCLVNKKSLSGKSVVHKLFLCDIEAHGHLVVFVVKKRNPKGILSLRLITCLENGSRHVIVLKGKTERSLVMNASLTQINPELAGSEILGGLRAKYGAVHVDSDILAYSFYVKPCRVFEIGAILDEGDAICLEAFGINKV